MERRKCEQGFTLVELIVTMVILGILVSAAIMRWVNLSNSAQAGACRTNQMALRTAQRLYYTQAVLEGSEGVYATNLADLADFLRDDKIPVCPGGGSYVLEANGDVYCTIASHQVE